MKQIETANQSGTTIEDWFSVALKFYEALSNKAFAHIQCYNILSQSAKWNEHCAELEKKKMDVKKRKCVSVNGDESSAPLLESHSTITSSDNLDGGASEASTIQLKRPIGNKTAKEATLKVSQDKKWKDNIIEVHQDLAKQACIQNEILAGQQEALTTLANKAIMKTNLSSVSAVSQPFFEWQQKKILDKMHKEQEKMKEN
ncbi:hypothetical protein PCASD_09842 [Puccinia coronata f. sp. avenae]|nr:hypothetical protein PCASD_19089 [Puccinia coronata f. sp. avenae]PLW38874.1 hypothetical protein PCASD_09842 [Puccinia coronata f. sp. avenae]